MASQAVDTGSNPVSASIHRHRPIVGELFQEDDGTLSVWTGKDLVRLEITPEQWKEDCRIQIFGNTAAESSNR